jgi:hypothetical protein
MLPQQGRQKIMSNQLNLSELSTKQIVSLLWELKGTPQAQPLYEELANRPAKASFNPDDPEWEKKFRHSLSQAGGIDRAEVNQ